LTVLAAEGTACTNGADRTGSGIVREHELRTLAANGSVDAKVEGATLKIRLGEHSMTLRAGKSSLRDDDRFMRRTKRSGDARKGRLPRLTPVIASRG
jgi:hypothetical protein